MIKIGDGLDHFLFDQLLYQLVAETFDVHGATTREMQNRPRALRRAIKTGSTVMRDLTFLPDDLRTTLGAFVRYVPQARSLRALFLDDANDFRNDIAGAAHDDGVTDAHILAP